MRNWEDGIDVVAGKGTKMGQDGSAASVWRWLKNILSR